MVATSEAKKHAQQVVRRLRRDYPDAECALRYENPLQLLVATILSAQCTDKQVNIVTETLFKKLRTAEDFANISEKELGKLIQPTGFFRNKAKNIKGCCQALVKNHAGEVPREIEQLVELPGVGRKTANVVLGTAFDIASGVVVDTHVGRITQRLGMTKHKQAEKIEQDLMACLPKKEWILFSHRLIHHGRQVCLARRPRCDDCGLADVCPRVGVST